MRTTFELQVAPRRGAAHLERDVVVPTHVAHRRRERGDLPTVGDRVGHIHLVEVAGEEVGLLTSFGASDLHDHVLAVVGVDRQHQLTQFVLDRRDLGAGRFQLGDEHVPFVTGRTGQHVASSVGVGLP
jgi:hypothetical protein